VSEGDQLVQSCFTSPSPHSPDTPQLELTRSSYLALYCAPNGLISSGLEHQVSTISPLSVVCRRLRVYWEDWAGRVSMVRLGVPNSVKLFTLSHYMTSLVSPPSCQSSFFPTRLSFRLGHLVSL
jgi:hypothetical protein